MGKKDVNKCLTPYCRNYKAKERDYCYKCVQRKWRKNNPIKAAYNSLRDNAKRRKKEFTITFEEFKKFAVRIKLIDKRNIKKYHWHIDRKDEDKGYTLDNIQMLTNSENVKKYFEYSALNKKGRYYIKKEKQEDKDVPF